MADETDALGALDPQLAALVSAYETATARDAAQVDAALARVTTKVGAAASAGAGASTIKLVLVGVIFAVVAVVGLVALRPASAPTPSEISDSAATPAIVVDETPRSVAVEPTHVDVPPPIETVDAPAIAAPRPSKSRARPPKPAPSDSLQAELELLRRARSALREGRAQRALEIVREHRRAYPSSAVAEERDATEISALCALDQHDDAKAKATVLAGKSSRSIDDLLGGCR
ncbi:MAG TPA: hypothetical protein VG755_06160 [Nannocystaceae bacterium]|nr:hypothetical protein [Nannocystaceae bacterium]